MPRRQDATLWDYPNLYRCLHIFIGKSTTGKEKIPVDWSARFRLANEVMNKFNWTAQDFRGLLTAAQLRAYIDNNKTEYIDEGSIKCIIQVFFEFEPPKDWGVSRQ